MSSNDLGLLALLAKRFSELQASFTALSKQPGPVGKDGARGAAGPAGKKGAGGMAGADGEPGAQGPQGAQGLAGAMGERGPAGPKPKHEWVGTKLRFEKPDGSWGKAVELRGPVGPGGSGGGGGGLVREIVTPEDEMMFAKRVDFVGETVIYRGEASVGSLDGDSAWRIRKIVIGTDGDVTETWADGTADFDKVWSDRAGYAFA